MSGEKTEQPSAKRLRDAREQGDVAKSTEIVSAATVIAVICYFVAQSDDIFQEFSTVVSYVLENASKLSYEEGLRLISGRVVEVSFIIVAPLVSLVVVVALVSIISQVGFLFAPKAAMPKLENLNPAK